MGAPLLKGHFQTPALHEVAHDLFCCLSGVSGKDGFGGTLALRITGQYPSDRQRITAIAVPQGWASANLHSSFSFPIPVPSTLLEDRFAHPVRPLPAQAGVAPRTDAHHHAARSSLQSTHGR